MLGLIVGLFIFNLGLQPFKNTFIMKANIFVCFNYLELCTFEDTLEGGYLYRLGIEADYNAVLEKYKTLGAVKVVVDNFQTYIGFMCESRQELFERIKNFNS